MAFICLCGQRYASQQHSVGCPRCVERAAARRAKTFGPPSPPRVPGRPSKPKRKINLAGLPLNETVNRAVKQHINRVGVPAPDVLASGSPVTAVEETITTSCASSDLDRLRSEAARLARNARQPASSPLRWAIEIEFRRQIKSIRTRERMRPWFRSVSGGLPGSGRRA